MDFEMDYVGSKGENTDLDKLARHINESKKNVTQKTASNGENINNGKQCANGFFTAQGGYINYDENSINHSDIIQSQSNSNEISINNSDYSEDNCLLSTSNSIESIDNASTSCSNICPDSIESIDSFNSNDKILSHVNTCNNCKQKIYLKQKKPLWELLCDSIEIKEFLIIIMLGMLLIVIIDICVRQS